MDAVTVQQADADAINVLWDDGDSRGTDPSLVVALRQVRRGLLRHTAIVACLRDCRARVSPRDFFVSASFLLTGTVGQAYAVTGAPLLVPLLLALQVAGLIGFVSLGHESWHRRALPWQRLEHVISEWLIAPLLVASYRTLAEVHRRHHKAPGEAEDIGSPLWNRSDAEFSRALVRRLLVAPGVVDAVRGLLFGRRAGYTPVDAALARPGFPETAAVVSIHLLWFLSLLRISLATAVVGQLVPLAITATLAHLRETREHTRLEDGRLVVYDTLCGTLERGMVAGGYFNLHALHHMFPEVPQRQLPRLYATIARTVDLATEYYGASPQIRRQRSYVGRRTWVPRGPVSATASAAPRSY